MKDNSTNRESNKNNPDSKSNKDVSTFIKTINFPINNTLCLIKKPNYNKSPKITKTPKILHYVPKLKKIKLIVL
jgi:hypothetical protein